MKSNKKSIPRHRLSKTVAYILRPNAEPEIVRSNCGSSLIQVQKTLTHLSGLRQATLTPCQHIMFSPVKKDKLTRKKDEQIADYFYSQLSLPIGWPFVFVKHKKRGKKPEPHYHILLPLVNDQGVRLKNPPTHYLLIKICSGIEDRFNLVKTPGLGNTHPGDLRIHFRLNERIKEDKLTQRDLDRIALFFFINEALEATVTGRLEDFAANLSHDNIEIILAKNQKGFCGVIFKHQGRAYSGSSLSENYSLANLLAALEKKLKKYDYPSARTPAAFIPTAAEAVAGDNGTIIPTINPADIRPGPGNADLAASRNLGLGSTATEPGKPAFFCAATPDNSAANRRERGQDQKSDVPRGADLQNQTLAPERRPAVPGGVGGVATPDSDKPGRECETGGEAGSNPDRHFAGNIDSGGKPANPPQLGQELGRRVKKLCQQSGAAGHNLGAGKPPVQTSTRPLQQTQPDQSRAREKKPSDSNEYLRWLLRATDAVEPMGLGRRTASFGPIAPGGSVASEPGSSGSAIGVDVNNDQRPKPAAGMAGGITKPAVDKRYAAGQAAETVPNGNPRIGSNNPPGNPFAGQQAGDSADKSGDAGRPAAEAGAEGDKQFPQTGNPVAGVDGPTPNQSQSDPAAPLKAVESITVTPIPSAPPQSDAPAQSVAPKSAPPLARKIPAVTVPPIWTQPLNGKPRNKLTQRLMKLIWRKEQCRLLEKCSSKPEILPTLSLSQMESLLTFCAGCPDAQLGAVIATWLDARQDIPPPAGIKNWVAEEMSMTEADHKNLNEELKKFAIEQINKAQPMTR